MPGALVGWWVLLTALITLPGTLDPFLIPKWFAYLTGALVMLALWREPGRKSSPRLLDWLIAYISVMFMLKFMGQLVIAKPGVGAVHWNMSLLLASVTAIISLLLARTLIRQASETFWVNMAGAICITATVTMALALAQYVGLFQFLVPESSSHGASRMMATLGNKMLMGNYVAIAASLFLPFKRWRLAWWACLAIVLLSDNKASLLAMMAGASVWLAMSKSKLAGLPLVGLAIGLVFFAIDKGADGSRFLMWQESWSYFVNNHMAYTGYGLGSFNDVFRLGVGQRSFQSAFAHPHNEYIWAVFELGLIGGGLAIANLVGLAKRAQRAKVSPLYIAYLASFISILVISLFGFPLHVAPLGLCCLLIYSGLESLTQGVNYVSA